MSPTAPSRIRRMLRILIPALLVVAWVAAAAIGGPYFGRVSEVSTNDPTAYLPTTAEATQVQERLSDFLGDDAIPAVVLVLGDTTLDEAQLEELSAWPEKLAGLSGVVGEGSPAIPSEDGMAVQLFVPIDSTSGVAETVEELRADLASLAPDGTEVYVTGPAGFTGDLVAAFAGIDGLLLLVASLYQSRAVGFCSILAAAVILLGHSWGPTSAWLGARLDAPAQAMLAGALIFVAAVIALRR